MLEISYWIVNLKNIKNIKNISDITKVNKKDTDEEPYDCHDYYKAIVDYNWSSSCNEYYFSWIKDPAFKWKSFREKKCPAIFNSMIRSGLLNSLEDIFKEIRLRNFFEGASCKCIHSILISITNNKKHLSMSQVFELEKLIDNRDWYIDMFFASEKKRMKENHLIDFIVTD